MGRRARHGPAQIGAQQALQQPVQGQGQAHGHHRRAEHDHPAAQLGAQQAQGRQGQQKKRAGPPEKHQDKTGQANDGGFHPGMEIGEERREAQILHFNNGLGHRGID